MFHSFVRKIPLVLLLILIPSSSALAAAYPDVDYNHPFLRGIVGMTNDKIVSGYEDKTFHPDDGISRIEALKIILKSADVSLAPSSSSSSSSPPSRRSIGFPDVPLDTLYAPYVNTGE